MIDSATSYWQVADPESGDDDSDDSDDSESSEEEESAGGAGGAAGTLGGGGRKKGPPTARLVVLNRTTREWGEVSSISTLRAALRESKHPNDMALGAELRARQAETDAASRAPKAAGPKLPAVTPLATSSERPLPTGFVASGDEAIGKRVRILDERDADAWDDGKVIAWAPPPTFAGVEDGGGEGEEDKEKKEDEDGDAEEDEEDGPTWLVELDDGETMKLDAERLKESLEEAASPGWRCCADRSRRPTRNTPS